MKKIETRYVLTDNLYLIINEEVKDHMCLVEFGEPCSGILRHWGSQDDLVVELKKIIEKLEDINLE